MVVDRCCGSRGFVASGYFYLRLSLPQIAGEAEVGGIDGAVEILRDERAKLEAARRLVLKPGG